MNKKVVIPIIIIALIVLVIVVVSVINKDNQNIQINIEELATNISQSGAFEDELAKVDPEMTKSDYGFSDEEIKEIVSYQGSGATSEEIVIFQVNDKSYLNSVKEKINTRLEERKEAFEGYLPEEVFKIENNVLDIRGNYVILCISNDSGKVEETINNYIKNKGF